MEIFRDDDLIFQHLDEVEVLERSEGSENRPGPAPLVNITPVKTVKKPLVSTAARIKRKLGPDTKLLKTDNITPFPDFQGMNNDELKVRDLVEH